MRDGSGGGPRSAAQLGLLVGGDWSTECHLYGDRSPILSVRVGGLSLTISPRDGAVTAGHLEFCHALAEAAGTYLIECDRILVTSAEADTGDGREAAA